METQQNPTKNCRVLRRKSKIPMSLPSFYELRRHQPPSYFHDNSLFLEVLVIHEKHQCFFKPANIGKTMLLDMMHKYHGLEFKDDYAILFKGLTIYDSEYKANSNQYLVLRTGVLTQSPLKAHIIASIRNFNLSYKTQMEERQLTPKTFDYDSNILNAAHYLQEVVSILGYKIMWLVDEWEQFSVDIMSESASSMLMKSMKSNQLWVQ